MGEKSIEANSLAVKRPDIAVEWDYEKNSGTPYDYSAYSSKEVYWKDSYGHSWPAVIKNRTRQKSGCPYCGNRKLLKGFNDLAFRYPELAEEWDYELNDKKPDEVIASGHDRYHWICPIGHRWEAEMYSRTIQHSGCRVCNRLGTSFPEQAIFYYVKKEFPDAVNGYLVQGVELDIYIPSKKAAIEYDGHRFHKSQDKAKKDSRKDKLCHDLGITLIRIREEGLEETDSAICYFRENPENDESLDPCIHFIFDNLDIKTDTPIHVKEDHFAIRSSYYRYVNENNFGKLYPILASEWCYEKNGDLTPSMFTPHSGEPVFWKCKRYSNHIWSDSINHRSTLNRGCPYCSNQKILPGFNDFATKNPSLAKEWSPNNKKKPSEVFPTSHSRYLWICPNCKQEYPASIANRSKGKACPFCNHRKPIKGKTDFKAQYPQLAEEWDYEKNGNLRPEDFLPFSEQDAWWICSKGHSYSQKIGKRASGQGCPYCSNNKVIPGENDLASLRPDLAREWDLQKNEKKPSEVKLKSNIYAWWKCSQCGKEWQAYVYNRAKSKTANCQECNRRKRKSTAKR